MRKAYKQTKVPVSRSQEGIRKILRKYGVVGYQFTDNLEDNTVVLRFVKRVEGTPRTVQITLATENNEQQAYRALYYWLKSQLEAVDFGLLSFEHVFLAHFEWVLDSGERTTIGDMILPRLAQQDHGRLLEGPEEIEEAEYEVVE